MEFQITSAGRGARVEKIIEPDPVVYVPETWKGLPVTELGAYALADSEVEELHLPLSLEKIGAYAFYNCERLKRIFCGSRISDLGTGLFAGTKGAEYLDFSQAAGERSYFKDMLAELRQTLRVRLHGKEEARLIFPEYYEEWVENTPARILFNETHGCGHRYRYCFRSREFQYRDYDELFPHVQVQESERLVTELALGRLMYPCGLTEGFRDLYEEYIREHWEMAGILLIEADAGRMDRFSILDPGMVPWLAERYITDETQASRLIFEAQKAGDTEAVSWLMNWKSERFAGRKDGRSRRFSL